jgi:BASS family bile acid:Na+ symporter
MLAMGFGLTVGGIIAPLRDIRRVVMSVLANFLLVPLIALALAALLRLDEPLGVGLLLLGSAAGAPFLPKLTQLAKGNLALAVGLMVLLMVVTVGYLPLVLPLLLSGVSVNSAKIARSLFLLMLLPLAGALAFKARFATAAARTRPILDRISNLSLILFVLLLITVNFNNVLAVFGTRGILAGLLFIAISFGTGWFFGGSDGVLDEDGIDRGLMFAFVGAVLGRQFEFVQSEWMNGASFFGGSHEKDPIAGASAGDGTFDIPKRPIRRRMQGLPRFVITRGGEYCFLPGLKALRYLGSLSDTG